MNKSSRVMVVGPSWVGDMIMAQSLFITLKKSSRTNVLEPTWSFSLLERMPEVTKAIAMPLTHGLFCEGRWALLNDARMLDKQVLSMTEQRFVALGLPDNTPLPPDYLVPNFVINPDQQNAVIEKFNLMPSEKILALYPGAEYGAEKRWPVSYYAEVARHKIAQGWQVWLFGSDKDK